MSVSKATSEFELIGPLRLFQQKWFHEAVVPGASREVLVESDGEVHARLAYFETRYRGFPALHVPYPIYYLTPSLTASEGKNATRLRRENHLVRALIRKLPEVDFIDFRFGPDFQNLAPFLESGFSVATDYTWALDSLGDLDRMWDESLKRGKYRYNRAVPQFQIREDVPVDEFLKHRTAAIVRKHSPKDLPDIAAMTRVDRECAARDCRKILAAVDERGTIHALSYLVWDSNEATQLMSCRTEAGWQNDAATFLLWETIKFAATKSSRLDFTPTPYPWVSHQFRQFGALPRPVHVLKWRSPRGRLLAAGAELAKSVRDLKLATATLAPELADE